jgi:putative PIN family toxin of toxin-antitoxin system
LRVILDTNAIISALLFKGEAARLAPAWKSARFKLLASPNIAQEYMRVLSYAKFKNGEVAIASFLNEGILPYLEPVKEHIGKLAHPCKDPDDDLFLRAAIGGRADYLVTGDAALLSLRAHYSFKIVTIKEFLTELGRD